MALEERIRERLAADEHPILPGSRYSYEPQSAGNTRPGYVNSERQFNFWINTALAVISIGFIATAGAMLYEHFYK